MKTITRLALIISMVGSFLAAEVQAAPPVSGAAKAAKAIFGGGAINGAKRVKITPPPAVPSGGNYTGGSSAAPWVYGGSRAVNEYQKNQQRQEQQRQQRGYGYPTSRY